MAIQVTCPSCKSKFNAPDAAAGKRTKCPKCAGVIQIPMPAPAEEILEAEVVPATVYTDDDFAVDPPPQLPEEGDRKPCPKCGQMIARSAMKCRHCGEIFDPLLREQSQKSVSSSSSSSDSDLSVGDWLLCIICSGIGCIMGIIYIVQGKPKGPKMLLISILADVVKSAISIAIQSANQ